MLKSRCLVFLLMGCCLLMLLTSCYRRPLTRPHGSVQVTEEQLDSITFARTHHYTMNFNFVVSADSVMLTRQLPEEALSDLPTDSFAVKRNAQLVVADVHVLPLDTVDSVWVQLADVNGMFGWVHESELLQKADPDDPISQFISFFSDEHMLIFMVVFVLIIVAYGLRKLFRMNAHIVHFNDIDTFYPTLLTLVVATAATAYSSVQLFEPDDWQEFYFHPSLNPFSQTPLIACFLCTVWAMLIVAMAAVDDTMRHLPIGEAVLYLLGLVGICALNYIVFSVSTLYYVGYLLLVAYVAFALWRYFTVTKRDFLCGNCGHQIKEKGICPHCGALNE